MDGHCSCDQRAQRGTLAEGEATKKGVALVEGGWGGLGHGQGHHAAQRAKEGEEATNVETHVDDTACGTDGQSDSKGGVHLQGWGRVWRGE